MGYSALESVEPMDQVIEARHELLNPRTNGRIAVNIAKLPEAAAAVRCY
jgi:hypothetical protein